MMLANLPLDLIAEAVVAGLLILTIFYCMMLNGRLKRLRADEESLRVTIAELITATEIAERAIGGLKATAAECDASIGQRIREAEALNHDMSAQVASGAAIVQRLSKISKVAGGAGVPARAPAPALRTASEPEPSEIAAGIAGLANALKVNAGEATREVARTIATSRTQDLDRAAQAIRAQLDARRKAIVEGGR